MRVLLTRSAEDAEPLAERLGAAGFDCLIEPMLTFTEVDGAAVELDQVQALLFTSANGARAFARLSSERNLPVYAVGDATAAAARAAGFSGVESAAGDVDSLAALVTRRLRPVDGALYHGAARDVAGDLAGRLGAAGFEVRRVVLYTAEPRERLSRETYDALRQGSLGAVTFFSPRTAETFVRLIEDSALADACTRCHAVCLSPAVADKASRLAWSGIAVAERPGQESLIRLLVELKRDFARVERSADRDQVNATDTRMAQDKETETTDSEHQERQQIGGQPPALQVIAAFGGIRPMASKLGIAVSTVQGWRERAVIPLARHEEVLAVAEERRIEIDPALVRASGERPPDPEGAAQDGTAQERAAEAEPSAAEAAATVPEEAAVEPDAGADAPAARIEPETAGEPTPSGPAKIAPPPAATPRRGGGLLVGFLLGVLVLGGGIAAAIYGRDLWQPYFQPADDPRTAAQAQAVESLEGGLGALESELASFNQELGALRGEIEARPPPATVDLEPVRSALADLGKRLQGLEAAPPNDSQLAERLAQIEQRLEQLAAAPAAGDGEPASALSADQAAGLAARLDALEPKLEALAGLAALAERQDALATRLDQIEDDAAAAAAEAEARAAEAPPAPSLPPAPDTLALLLSLDKLQLAVADDRPFAQRFAVVERLAGELDDTAEPLAVLGGVAESGVATREQLRAEFPAVARAIAAAGSGEGQDDWSARVLRSLSGVVSVRRTGEVEGDSAEAIAARAEQRVASDDLAGALEALDALTARAAEAAAAWRGKAEQRLAVEQAIETLSDRIVARLAPSED